MNNIHWINILQERRYCIGPAMLDRTMSANKLCGNVAQTHFTIQNAVAYLASLLFKRSQSLIVYGAAERFLKFNRFVNESTIFHTVFCVKGKMITTVILLN